MVRWFLLMTDSPSYAVATLRQFACLTLTGSFWAEDFRERDCRHMLIGSVHNLDVPASPILALLIAIRDHVAGFSERVRSCCLEARVRPPFRVFDDATRGPDVEVVQSRFRLALGREGRLVGRMA